MESTYYIEIRGAKEHNLKNIDVRIPRNKLIVVTGLSGSGKSSLAFDTIYAEGQRRYVESLSSYARQFLDKLKKPDVESIAGLTPTIAIEQRSGQSTPRSTVATTTEIYDYLRVLFARAGVPFCPQCDKPIHSQSPEDVVKHLSKLKKSAKIQIYSPMVRGKKGEHLDIFNQLMKDGFSRTRVNGEIYSIEDVPTLESKKAHTIEAVVDRIVLKDNLTRLNDSIEIAMKLGNGVINVLIQEPDKEAYEEMFSEKFSCPEHGSVLEELHPRIFSFNSPFGACHKCNGLGTLLFPDPDIIIPDPTLSLEDGAIQVWKRCGSGMNMFYPNSVKHLAKLFDISITTPWNKLSPQKREGILHGGHLLTPKVNYEGILNNLMRRFQSTDSESQKNRIHEYLSAKVCDKCLGSRLKPEVLAVKISGKSLADITSMTVTEAENFFNNLKLDEERRQIAEEVVKAIRMRLMFMINVGLNYLTLNRLTRSLSGGEAQRIRLAGQVGAKLSGVTYVLDEPTIGLHQRDNDRLISTLKSLRDLGNTLIVVEHDEEVIRSADYIYDIGPGAGEHGGKIVAEGELEEFKKFNSITAKYLSGELSIKTPLKRRKIINSRKISIKGCTENNLKNVDADFPLGLFICVTGVSGSGKSTLVNECLLKGLKRELNSAKVVPGKFKSFKGIENIDKIIDIDQSPIGRTPRSNPATYIGIFDDIRSLYALTNEAKSRGYTRGRFSFNVKGGRCEACQGQGQKVIEMHFLPDVYVQCESCRGLRYNKETLQVKYRNKNIAEVLNMPVDEACEFFENHTKVYNGLKTLLDTGLGYVRLGQPSTTLSGGEAQRIKLASELSRSSTGKTLYVMDEPSTGLHFHDIAKLIDVIQRLADAGNTMIVIEHNLDIIKCADHIIDLGPEGGDAGGTINMTGTPEDIADKNIGHTAHYLKKILA